MTQSISQVSNNNNKNKVHAVTDRTMQQQLSLVSSLRKVGYMDQMNSYTINREEG